MTPPDRPTRAPRRALAALAAGAVLGGLALAAPAVGAQAAPPPGPTAAVAADAGRQARPDRELEAALDGLVATHGFPGVLANVVDARGRDRDYTAGVGELESGRPVPADGQVRIGSNTKTFTASVVLQLVAEGKVALDEPIETYLPGVVRGEGIDATAITVRNLLQHTSGLAEYLLGMDLGDPPDFFKLRDRYWQPRDLVDLSLAQGADFQPGEQWAYSNTNYVLAGLIVERVTGRPLAEQITERIITPLGLRDTYVPLPGERDLRGRHPQGYHPAPDGTMTDITRLDPSFGGAAGDMVSTPSDLNRFFSALVAGEVVPAAQLAEMQTTVPLPEGYPGDGYGLGLISTELSCGDVAWGHGGDIPGFSSRGGAVADGRAATIVTTSLVPSTEALAAAEQAVDTALC